VKCVGMTPGFRGEQSDENARQRAETVDLALV
jgi:hypothetical protein